MKENIYITYVIFFLNKNCEDKSFPSVFMTIIVRLHYFYILFI